MRRLKILIWHIHGSYLNSLARIDHDWYLPVKAERHPIKYSGRGPTFNLPNNVHEVQAERVRELNLDLIIYQAPENYYEDAFEILSAQQRALPKIYLEHNTPRPHPTDTKHPINDPNTLLVHVTEYNQLMWDNGQTPTIVIEHSVFIDPAIIYHGQLSRGITVINELQRRGRVAGYDLFLRAQDKIPLDLAGMMSEQLGGLGDIPYHNLHSRIANYRFLFSPMRYTSTPMAVVEAMMIAMPVVVLATTELPRIIENGQTGYISCNVNELIEQMDFLLDNPAEASRLGRNAQAYARRRFGLSRFIKDWNEAFARVGAL